MAKSGPRSKTRLTLFCMRIPLFVYDAVTYKVSRKNAKIMFVINQMCLIFSCGFYSHWNFFQKKDQKQAFWNKKMQWLCECYEKVHHIQLIPKNIFVIFSAHFIDHSITYTKENSHTKRSGPTFGPGPTFGCCSNYYISYTSQL